MFSRVSFLFALALALTPARPVAAQQTVDVGSVSGRVVDESGLAVPGASVEVIHAATHIAAAEVTNTQGRLHADRHAGRLQRRGAPDQRVGGLGI